MPRLPHQPAGLVLLLALATGAGCGGSARQPPQMLTVSGVVMGTTFTVKVVAPPASVEAESLEEGVVGELRRVEGLLSTYNFDSELSRLNRFHAADWFPVSPETATVVHEALQISRLSGGAFDVTVAPLVNLWNFGPVRRTTGRVPPPDEIEEVKARVGFQNIEVRLEPPAIRKLRGDVSIDLSGIAKGFAVDQVAAYLEGLGVANYMVDVGGEVKARGANPSGKPWQIAVESPLAETREVYKVIPLDGLSVATSGDYRNYFEQGGIRYSHLIDPRCGRPIAHKLASVSVLDPSCTRADALATALMVLGPEAGYNSAVEHGWAALLLVKSDGGFTECATPAFEVMLRQGLSQER